MLITYTLGNKCAKQLLYMENSSSTYRQRHSQFFDTQCISCLQHMFICHIIYTDILYVPTVNCNSIWQNNTMFSLKYENSKNNYFDSSSVRTSDDTVCYQFGQKSMFHIYLFLQ